jgi:hypothetical protein
LTRQIDGFGPEAARRPLLGWMVVGSAVAGIAGLLAVAGVILPGVLSEDGSSTTNESVSAPADNTPVLDSTIVNARESLEALQQKASAGRDIGLRDLNALTGATRTLAETTDPDTLAATEADELEDIVQEQLSLLQRLGPRSTAAEKQEIATALVLTHRLAETLGLEETATASPAATSPPSDSPTDTPGPASPPASPTTAPEPQVSPTPVP